tara:strand:- start:288 stop:860 length:573 start_codon:yes stop_codon:yes gene_type:complete
MTIQKPSKGRLRVEIDPSIHKRILNNLPEHKRSQPLTHIVNDLIHEALDTQITLGKPSPLGASERAKVLHSYINKNKESNKEVKKKLDIQEFEKFWETYRSSVKRVRNPKKQKAKLEFDMAVKSGVEPNNLIKAAEMAVNEQRLAIDAEGWAECLPDAFRWLKERTYETLLTEATITKHQQQNINQPVIL